MAIYLLDTSALTLLQRGHSRVRARHQTHKTESCVSSVTIEESLGGWLALLRQAKTNPQRAFAALSLSEAVVFLADFKIHTMTSDMYDRYDSLVKQKLNIGSMDLKIAASALELRATVVTQNVRDFRRVAGLIWEDWTQ